MSHPRLAAPSPGRAAEHISSFSLLVAGVKGPLHLHGERQINPWLQQGTRFFIFTHHSHPAIRFKGSLLCLLILGCEWEGVIRQGGKALTVGKGPSHQCVKREGRVGIKNVNFMGSD